VGQHPVDPVGRLADVLPEEERAGKIRGERGPLDGGEKRQATAEKRPGNAFAGIAPIARIADIAGIADPGPERPPERLGDGVAPGEGAQEGLFFHRRKTAGEVRRHHRAVEGDEAQTGDDPEEKRGEV
jgi:hypothetical protein